MSLDLLKKFLYKRNSMFSNPVIPKSINSIHKALFLTILPKNKPKPISIPQMPTIILSIRSQFGNLNKYG